MWSSAWTTSDESYSSFRPAWVPNARRSEFWRTSHSDEVLLLEILQTLVDHVGKTSFLPTWSRVRKHPVCYFLPRWKTPVDQYDNCWSRSSFALQWSRHLLLQQLLVVLKLFRYWNEREPDWFSTCRPRGFFLNFIVFEPLAAICWGQVLMFVSISIRQFTIFCPFFPLSHSWSIVFSFCR